LNHLGHAIEESLWTATMALVGRAWPSPLLTVRAGLRDALGRRIATREWAIWRPEVAWLTGYFSVAVWLSVSLVHFARR
jgi:hypothetical protein